MLQSWNSLKKVVIRIWSICSTGPTLHSITYAPRSTVTKISLRYRKTICWHSSWTEGYGCLACGPWYTAKLSSDSRRIAEYLCVLHLLPGYPPQPFPPHFQAVQCGNGELVQILLNRGAEL
ncbi:hypothetical protein ASPBRDRAFT_38321, partial [Aspergillus brasiliensis CBS 101740]